MIQQVGTSGVQKSATWPVYIDRGDNSNISALSAESKAAVQCAFCAKHENYQSRNIYMPLCFSNAHNDVVMCVVDSDSAQ